MLLSKLDPDFLAWFVIHIFHLFTLNCALIFCDFPGGSVISKNLNLQGQGTRLQRL